MILFFFLMFGYVLSFVTSLDQITAFTVAHDNNVHVTAASVIPFNKTTTVYGTSNPLNPPGVFTCQESGLYKFQLYCLTQKNTQVFLEIYRNQELVSTARGKSSNGFADAANAVVLNLIAGDNVYVKNRANYDTAFYGSPDQIYTTFTGVQIGNSETDEIYPNSNAPAFSVGVSHHQNVIGGSDVIYDKINLDNTNAYDRRTGVYTAAFPGVYIFHFFTLSSPNQAVWLELYHNNDYVCSIYCKEATEFADAGNTAILHLKAGDMVKVQSRNGKNADINGSLDEIYTTFSGALIANEIPGENYGERVVAFSAGLTRSVTIPGNDKVVYDRIFIDLHHDYDHHTGEFTAPVRGVYEFNYHALGQNDIPVWLELYRNYRYVNSLYSSVTGDFPDAGNAAVIDLDVGDVVYVKVRSGALFGASDEVYCTFSGYLISGSSTSVPAIATVTSSAQITAFTVAHDSNVNATAARIVPFSKIFTTHIVSDSSLVEETGEPGENHRPSASTVRLSHMRVRGFID